MSIEMINYRNPYITETGKPVLMPSVVAFIDILGYQDLVRVAHEKNKSQELLNNLHEVLVEGVKFLGDEGEAKSLFQPQKDFYKLRTFTDNIVIGYPILDDAEYEFGEIFFKLSLFQTTMVNAGFFIRGAISIGDLYMDEFTIFGNGLIEAHKGEKEFARDPRIVLTESAQTEVQKHLTRYSEGFAPHLRDLYKDADGQFFLNYLDSILIAEDEQGPYFKELEKHKKIVEQKLEEYKSKPTVWAKYSWVANYHNYFCDRYPYFNESHKIDLIKFQMKPSLLSNNDK